MTREELKKLTKKFFRTYGYANTSLPNNAEFFSRPTGAGMADELLVYFHEEKLEKMEKIKEDASMTVNLRNLASKYERIPGGENGRRFFLSDKPLGSPLPESITKEGFKYQVPVWFFDREFSSARKKTPLKNFEENVIKHIERRIPQPFKSKDESGENLLKHLSLKIKKANTPNLIVIIAPAGYGKTVLMGRLYINLLERFYKRKKNQKLGLRPIIMLPGHIKRAEDLEGLLNNFANDEYYYGDMPIDALKFWFNQNFAVWLLDGLEELIIKIPDEFLIDLLDNYITNPDSKNPQIIISIRKSLLATSPELREALKVWEDYGITTYELIDWGDKQKEKYFEKNLSQEQDMSIFIKEVKIIPTLNKLCDVPYYCSLISELRNEDKFGVYNDDTELVEYAFKRICEREFGKGLEKDICTVDMQKYLFSILALECFQEGNFTKDHLHDWAEITIPDDLADDIRNKQITCLERHAILSMTGDQINFLHEILKQYLIAVALLEDLKNNNLNDFDSGEIESDSFIYKFLLRNTAEYNWSNILQELQNLETKPQSDAKAFRNILKIYLAIPVEKKEDTIKDLLIAKNLSRLIFKDLNLKEFHFEKSKLTSVEFIHCDLTGAYFNNCHFKDTLISENCILDKASIKGAELESLRTSANRYIYDHKEIQKFFYEKTNIHEEIMGPCQAAINLKKIFDKFIRKGRGYNIPKNFILNLRCGGGTPTSQIINIAHKNGYLRETLDHLSIRKNVYDEVVNFVRNYSVTQGIKQILNSICRDTSIGCKHVPATSISTNSK